MSLGRGGMRLFRLAAILLAVWILRESPAVRRDLADDDPIRMDEARMLFPGAERLRPSDAFQHSHEVLDRAGALLGYLLHTAPDSDDLIGYAGPSDLLVGLHPDGRVARVLLLESGDTEAHVREVRDAAGFLESLAGWEPLLEPLPEVDAVAGSTLTSLVLAEGLERRLTGRSRSLRFPRELTLEEVQEVVPGGARLEADSPDGWFRVWDAQGQTAGFVVRSSPFADNVIGYAGPSDALIAVDSGRSGILAIRLRDSFDTPDYVDRVQRGTAFLDQLAGLSLDEWAKLDFGAARVEGVSGATQTSYALAEGVRRRLAAREPDPGRSDSTRFGLTLSDLALLLIVAGGLLLGLANRRTARRWRRLWQVVLVVGLGLLLGDLLSVGLLAGWSRHGAPFTTAPALLALVGVALVVPWSTRRQVYCQQLCPHGAVQEWLARLPRFRVHLKLGLTRGLRLVPGVSLGLVFLIALFWPAVDLGRVEPFDAWVLGTAATASLVLAVLGLVASLLVPMAYCRFGCPTGALLDFVRARGTGDRPRLRDGVVVLLLAVGAASVWLMPDGVAPDGNGSTPNRLTGTGFGTTWSIRLRAETRLPEFLRRRVNREIERIENALSSWSPGSEADRFNASATRLPLEVTEEFLLLVERGQELSRQTDGAFDLTVGPLVDLWGSGAGSAEEQRQRLPEDGEIEQVLARVGWNRLSLDLQHRTIAREHEQVQLDLGALLQGYAADRVGSILRSAGIYEFLIEIGGELLAAGSWKVALEDPLDPKTSLRVITLQDAALATSGVYRNDRHIISPRTGRPIGSTWSLCAVLRADAVAADGWATALLVSGERAPEIAQRMGLSVLLIDQQGRVTEIPQGAFR